MSKHPFEPIDVRFEVLAGLILLLNTLPFGFGFEGPWEDIGFTRGIGGLIGSYLLYRAWYARTFGFHGLIPALHHWKNPRRSTSRLILLGIGTLMLAWLIGNPFQDWFAEPTALVLTLYGLLMLLLATYAWLVFEGGLADEEE
ncbi:MAG: hypothetical protein CMB72_04970 [Euryarchaeota archaeon]|nr:hypothetical protein [Euryarchaeota archaeon]|tara:strand:- start:1347 stop:1775 length:429 start_codon:yes stop_codon:yes gene_type:complete